MSLVPAAAERPRGRLLIAAAVLGGFVSSLAFAPIGWVPMVIIGPALGLWAAALARTPGRGALSGLLFGLAFAFSTLRWMFELDPVAAITLPIVQAAFWAITGAVAATAARLGPGWWVAVVAATWTLAEAARARTPLTGFEWAQLSMAASDTGVRHAVASVGSLGLTGLLAALAAGTAVLALHAGRRRWLPLVGVALVLSACVAAGTLSWTAPDGELSVAVVQVDDPCPGDFAADCPGYGEELIRDYLAGTARLDVPTELVVWGEDALPGAPTLERAGAALVDRGVDLPAPVLAGVGTPVAPGQFLRWAALFDRDGAPLDAYAKRMPVPFGEYVPWRSALGGISDVGRLVPSDLQAGDDASPVVLETGDEVARLGTVVSWEVIFARAVRAVAVDANGLATVTTVASYGTSAASDQLLNAAQLRAAEHQKPMVVSATTGRSAIISSDGGIEERSALYRSDRLHGTMRLRSGLTPYARAGDTPVVVLAIIVVAAAVLTHGRRTRPTVRSADGDTLVDEPAGHGAG